MKIAILTIILCFLTGCSNNATEAPSRYADEDITVAIYPLETRNGTFFFNLNKDGALTFKYGANTQYYAELYDIKDYDFMAKKGIHAESTLSDDETSAIYSLVDYIYLKSPDYPPANPGDDGIWYIQIYYKDRNIKQNEDFWPGESPLEVQILIDELVKYMPDNVREKWDSIGHGVPAHN